MTSDHLPIGVTDMTGTQGGALRGTCLQRLSGPAPGPWSATRRRQRRCRPRGRAEVVVADQSNRASHDAALARMGCPAQPAGTPYAGEVDEFRMGTRVADAPAPPRALRLRVRQGRRPCRP